MMKNPFDTVATVSPSKSENQFIRKIPVNSNVPASLGLRASAFLIDYILTLLIFAAGISLSGIFKNGFPGVANVIEITGYLATGAFIVWNWGILCVREGQRIGQRLVGIKIIRADGAALGYRRIILRHLIGYPLSLIFLGLGFLWVALDPKQRGWHDRLAGTLVVKI